MSKEALMIENLRSDGDSILMIYDIYGRFIKKFTNCEGPETICKEDLNKGTYIYELMIQRKLKRTGKLIID